MSKRTRFTVGAVVQRNTAAWLRDNGLYRVLGYSEATGMYWCERLGDLPTFVRSVHKLLQASELVLVDVSIVAVSKAA